MIHSFDTEAAEKYGILEAVLLQNIYYWVEKNRANEANYFDGTYWTYNSTKAFNQLFSYVSERQIKYALKHLREEELILTGNYNKSCYDRTLWYALTKKGNSIVQKCPIDKTELSNGADIVVKSMVQECQMDGTDMSDGAGRSDQWMGQNEAMEGTKPSNGLSDNVPPIPNIKPNIKPNNKYKKSKAEELFEQLWKNYPCKRGKKQVSGEQKRKLLAIGLDEMERAVKRYQEELAEEAWKMPQYGGTFFSTGYVDYLDATYVRPEKREGKRNTGNAFSNFNQRTYDFDTLEQQLLKLGKENGT